MINIKIRNLLTPEHFERLEDDLRVFMKSKGLTGKIENEATGNTTKF